MRTMHGYGSDWGADTEAELTRLVDEGLSARAISKVMVCVSRNAVISKCRRMGLVLQGNRGRPSKLEDGAKAPKRPKTKPVAIGLITSSKISPPEVATAEIPLPEVSSPEVSRCSFFDLEPDMCRYMIGEPSEMRYCGDKTCNPKSMWCTRHSKMVYTPAAERRVSAHAA